jgi:hypothetical protein
VNIAENADNPVFKVLAHEALVSVRKHIECLESVVIQRWWPDSGRVTDVDATESQTLRPQPVAISE